ncbi:MAG: T9SS type A sorting domain-containing protein [Bacteroidales bacterium]|jgi:hypothetical protein|nr:T9SS type A sorting domain-containing protein [Bacteroidales bacterium]
MKIFTKTLLIALLFVGITGKLYSQDPTTYPYVSLDVMNLNRKATKLSSNRMNEFKNVYKGFRWNSGDYETLKWRPQGITTVNTENKEFVVVSWYGRKVDKLLTGEFDYSNRGVRVSFVDVTDMNNINYRHVLLVDGNYETISNYHGDAIEIVDGKMYVADSRTAKTIRVYSLDSIQEVSMADRGDFYDYRYILKQESFFKLPVKNYNLGYDRDQQKFISGGYNSTDFLWFAPETVDSTTAYFTGAFKELQGITSINDPRNPSNTVIWFSSSYGSSLTDHSYLRSVSFNLPQNTYQQQPFNKSSVHSTWKFPPGLEDLHVSESDDLWSLTEFSPYWNVLNLTNKREVFAMRVEDVLPTTHPSDYEKVPLEELNLNRTATKLVGALGRYEPAVKGYRWNSEDNKTLKWRPQGITGLNRNNKEWSVVSWYGRDTVDCNDEYYGNRGSRVSFVNITDMDNIKYRHVLLVDQNFETFEDMHAGGLAIVNDTLYVPDSRGSIDALYRFPLSDIREVPVDHRDDYYNYRYIIAMDEKVDSMPINPSFVSYDWDDNRFVMGSFVKADDEIEKERMMWFESGKVDKTSPYFAHVFHKMQGIATMTDPNNPENKLVWTASSYGYNKSSYLRCFSYKFPENTEQGQLLDINRNYVSRAMKPGLEDLHLDENNEYLWSLTEFSPKHGTLLCLGDSDNDRDVFAFAVKDILPEGSVAEIKEVEVDIFTDEQVCEIEEKTYVPTTEYVAVATFDKSDKTWVNLDTLSSALEGTDRSVFMWINQNTTVSGESQILFAINTSGGGNICNLQLQTDEVLGVYDGSNTHRTTTTITDGNWHHVGYTYNATTNETIIYVDGVAEATFTNAQAVTANAKISLGQEWDGSTKSNYYEGKMTEVSVWNTVLNSNEVELLKQTAIKSTHPKHNNLIAYYPMTNEIGDNLTIVKDVSGNTYNGYADGSMSSEGVNVQSITEYCQIPGFDGSKHFAKTWKENGDIISTSETFTVTDTEDKNYSVELTLGGLRITDNWTVDVNTSTDVVTAYESYTWIANGETYTESGLYTTTIVNAEGCHLIATLNLTITVAETGDGYISPDMSEKSINNSETGSVIIYPNPTDGLVNIELNKLYDEIEVQLLNVAGSIIETKTYYNQQNIKLYINRESGVYLIKLNIAGDIVVKRVALK